MAVVDILNAQAEKVSQAELPDAIYNVPVKASVLHAVTKWQLAKRRAGSASVKRRSDVKGSGRKLFRQKGTGQARRGDIKAPLLRGGGVTFGPSPRSYEFKLPKKVRALALKMALSSKVGQKDLMVLNNFEMATIKTRHAAQILDSLGLQNALVVTSADDLNLKLSIRNIPGIKLLNHKGLNVYDILKYKKLVLIETVLEKIERRLLA